MKKLVYITAISILFSCNSFCQEKEESFNAKDFYTEYIEPLDGFKNNDSSINAAAYVIINDISNLKRIEAVIDFQTKNLNDSGKWSDFAINTVINCLNKNLEQLFDMRDSFNYYKDRFPAAYSDKIFKEVDDSINAASRLLAEYNNLAR